MRAQTKTIIMGEQARCAGTSISLIRFFWRTSCRFEVCLEFLVAALLAGTWPAPAIGPLAVLDATAPLLKPWTMAAVELGRDVKGMAYEPKPEIRTEAAVESSGPFVVAGRIMWH